MIKEKERIQQFVESQGISNRKFSELCGLSSNFLSLESSPATDKLVKINSIYPQLNMDWVITGRGEMLFSEPQLFVGADGEAAQIAVDALKEQLRDIQADLIKCYKERDVERLAKELLQREKEELIREITNSHLKKQQPIT